MVVLVQKRLYLEKVVVFGKNVCIRLKGVIFGQSGCIRAKWFCSGKSPFIRARWFYSGKNGCNLGSCSTWSKVIVFGQKWL